MTEDLHPSVSDDSNAKVLRSIVPSRTTEALSSFGHVVKLQFGQCMSEIPATDQPCIRTSATVSGTSTTAQAELSHCHD